jgi:UDP-N-acetylmuramoyl-L-alanyl-D-glutamate--2,6-diaminopimelate ligase
MDRLVTLSGLFASLGLGENPAWANISISGVVMDSRQVRPGFLFVAASGGTTDGHRYIPDAVQRGAAGIVGEKDPDWLSELDLRVPYIQVPDSRLAVACLSAGFYGFPARQLTVIGVTGTDGKTTTSNLIYQILQQAGLRAGMISTVNAVIGDEILDTGFHVTTPDAPQIQQLLSRMVSQGISHVILEATSHGLAQRRVACCEFDIGLITNVSHEHLDFHGSFESYRAAKGLLFESLAKTPYKAFDPQRAAVLNRDDPSYNYLSGITRISLLSYGLEAGADIRGLNVHSDGEGLQFSVEGRDLDGEQFRFSVKCSLIGQFNLYNCLAAIALARGVMKIETESIAQALSALKPIPGRMERIERGQDFSAFVDFAHTPNALRGVLQACKALTEKKVIAVIGSAGERDRLKRRMMAEVSAGYADLTVLTAEDPRRESLAEILSEMADGARQFGGVEGKTFWRIPDRRDALRFAVSQAGAGDLVIACGKGHEQSMCFGEVEYPWDDRVALHSAIAEHLGIPGPQMPYLPPVG